jgi:hypothetical protein
MKKLLTIVVLALLATLYIGYYKELVEARRENVFFIKKHPTFQVRFYNIHANDGDYREIEQLTGEQRKKMIDYCRYRLGIDTELKTQADVVMCSKR